MPWMPGCFYTYGTIPSLLASIRSIPGERSNARINMQVASCSDCFLEMIWWDAYQVGGRCPFGGGSLIFSLSQPANLQKLSGITYLVGKNIVNHNPNAPSMDDLLSLAEKWVTVKSQEQGEM